MTSDTGPLPPKVLLLGPLPPPYMGPSVATEILLRSGLRECFTLIHLDTNLHKEIATLGRISLVEVLGNGLLYFRMLLLILNHRPALAIIPISQTTMGFLKDSIFILIARLFARKTVLQLRGGNFANWLRASSKITQTYVAFILRRTQGVIVLGKKLRDLFIDFFPYERIFVVPNGVDLPVSLPPKKISDKVRLLYLANLQASKGIEDVIGAAVRISEQFSSARYELDVVGDWFSDGIKENILCNVEHNNLPIVFHGVVTKEQKWAFLRNADIFIFPPREPEGHPWVIIEAMAAGLSIISTDQGAITESVIDGVNGFIVDKQSPEQISEKIKLLIQNEELRIKMGNASRQRYEEHFTEAKMVEKMAKVFNSVISKPCAG